MKKNINMRRKFLAFNKYAVSGNMLLIIAIILLITLGLITEGVFVANNDIISKYKNQEKVTLNVLSVEKVGYQKEDENYRTVLLEKDKKIYRIQVDLSVYYYLEKTGKKKITLWLSKQDLDRYTVNSYERRGFLLPPGKHFSLFVTGEIVLNILIIFFWFLPTSDIFECDYDTTEGKLYRIGSYIIPIILAINLVEFIIYT